MRISSERIAELELVLVFAVIGVAVVIFMPYADAHDFTVARGDTFVITGNDSPTDTPGTGALWLFGTTDSIYAKPFKIYGDTYLVNLSVADISQLSPGTYDYYLQFPGSNGVLDIDYNSQGEFGTIYRAIKNESVLGLSPRVAVLKLDKLAANSIIDDKFIKNRLIVEDPDVKVVNMYTTGLGDMHIDANTNLGLGDPIVGMIDEDTYQTPDYIAMMSDRTVVNGTEDERMFSLTFSHTIAPQLNVGTHFIYIHYLGNGTTTIPFQRYTQFIQPTPTPAIDYYFSINGELLGYGVNTTRPNETPTVTPTPVQTYNTVLVENRTYNNRTIMQHGDVYVGEQNLNVFGTLGWMSPDETYKLQYCEWDTNGTIITVKDPYHFFVDPALFRNYLGDWCQYDSSVYEYRPSVAFVVKWTNNLTGNMTYDSLGRIVNITPTPTPTVVPMKVSTPVPTVKTTVPTPIPTTAAIIVPLPYWLALVAVAGVYLWKHH